MTAPEMVEVVAEVLEEHCIDDDEICPYGCDVRDSETRFLRTHELRIAHQARAVLAALTEAGEVEWGVAWKGAGPSGVLAFDSEEDAREAVELGGLLSRLTLSWTKAT